MVFGDSIPKWCTGWLYQGFSTLDSKTVQRGVDCVDLGESFPMSIYLKHFVSIQRRTSLVKFARAVTTGVHITAHITGAVRIDGVVKSNFDNSEWLSVVQE